MRNQLDLETVNAIMLAKQYEKRINGIENFILTDDFVFKMHSENLYA